jgi:hypothetical protein
MFPRNPIISSRVRKLYIRAWFIAFLLKRDARYQQHTLPSSNILSILRSAVSTWHPLPRHVDPEFDTLNHTHEATPITSTKQLTACKAIRFMISAIRGMTNVTEFQFEWTDLPLTNDTKTFLISIGTAFGANLRKLTMHAHVLNFRDLRLVTSSTSIEELELHFDYSARTSSTKATKGNSGNDEHQELLAVVLPLIVQSSGVMRSLQIFSSSSVDLSGLFASLPPMPRLERFGVAIPFEKNILSDSFGLLDFLRRHSSSLHHVHLSPNLPYRTDMLQSRKKEVWEPVNDTLLDDTPLLSGLESLEIPFVSLEKTIPLLQRSANTLKSLVLTNQLLSFLEVMDVLAVFSHRSARLKTFHAEVEHFTSSQMREYRKYR